MKDLCYQFEIMRGPNQRAIVTCGCVIVSAAPGALFAAAVQRREDLEVRAKMREDPLFAIRQREEDAKRKILLNPIKMKQLQEMVSA